jgi:PhnB protein
MTFSATPHLNFRGNARAALAFYQAAFDGDLTIVTYQDAHQVERLDEADQVMWGQVATASGMRVMAFDVPASRPWHPGENAVYVVVGGTQEEIEGAWEKMIDGATVLQALAPSAWAPLYGMLKDRFGITWVLSIPAQAGTHHP